MTTSMHILTRADASPSTDAKVKPPVARPQPAALPQSKLISSAFAAMSADVLQTPPPAPPAAPTTRDPAVPAPPARPVDGPAAKREPLIPASVRDEHDSADTVLEALFTYALPALFFFLPALSATISPAVQEEGGSWWGLFTATLALSLGVAICVYMIGMGVMQALPGMVQFLLVGAILAGSSLIAAALGLGNLDNPAACKNPLTDPNIISGRDFFCSDPRHTGIAYIGQAILTFGAFGAILGAISGALAGAWAVRIYKRHN